MKLLPYLKSIVFFLTILSFTCCTDHKNEFEETEVLTLQSNIKIGENAITGQTLVLAAKLNDIDVTNNENTIFYVNGEKIEGNQFLIANDGSLKIYAEYKTKRSNELEIEAIKKENAEKESLIILESDAPGDKISLGSKISFTVKLKTEEGEKEITSEAKIYINGKELVGEQYQFDTEGMASVFAEFNNRKSDMLNFIVTKSTGSIIPEGEKDRIQIVRKYNNNTKSLVDEAESVEISVLGFNGDNGEKDINVYTYNINGQEIECTHWSIDFQLSTPGYQASFSVMIPLENGKIVNPTKAQKIYPFSLNLNLPGTDKEHHSLTLSAKHKDDQDILNKMTLEFKEFALGDNTELFFSDLNIIFQGVLNANIKDNYFATQTNTNIIFSCNPDPTKMNKNKLRVENDFVDVKREISINSIKDLF